MIVESTESQIKHECPNIANAVLGAVPVHKFPYNWNLKDANFTKDKGKVFSCFACGGGSTMGYKLVAVECAKISVNEILLINHNVKCDAGERLVNAMVDYYEDVKNELENY